jgi:hypothetical protein
MAQELISAQILIVSGQSHPDRNSGGAGATSKCDPNRDLIKEASRKKSSIYLAVPALALWLSE